MSCQVFSLRPAAWGRISIMPPGVGQFTELLDALACGAVLIGRGGVIVHVNPRACSMTGYAADSLVGRRLSDLYDEPEDKVLIDLALSDTTEPREGQFHVPTAAGRQIPVVISGRTWHADKTNGSAAGGEAYYAITLTDISPLKKAEDDLRTQYRIIAELSNTILSQALNLKDYSHELEARVRERTADLLQANMDAIYMLAIASESKDEDTGRHVRRMQHYTAAVATELGLTARGAEQAGYSAILHDIGKIHVPDHILKKPGPLTASERAAIQQHTIAGERILAERPFFEVARQIARSHHENWDGSGYPDKLAGREIPIEARIVHLADVYDALTSPRIYKGAWTAQDAAAVIEESTAAMFDPEIVKAFTSLRKRGELDRIAAMGTKGEGPKQ